ncbi:TonB-dependent siderophore receptor [Polaromonas sp. SM01]|uniref:TonB-dependent siderophore receptor n=1 Tax=Polaromonas sp. SM01 TaxID=3085630 RepID=UPI0029819187|nr:TonB-dependent siderophore receptor [Polaromonas sp. SM01]MDW5441942.1 TonB-dependent siderophore receptor [Polaromonas sp. SM01]
MLYSPPVSRSNRPLAPVPWTRAATHFVALCTLSPLTLCLAQGAAAPTLPAITVKEGTAQETATGPVIGFVAKRGATATKTDTPLIETPQSISVITRDRLEAQGGLTINQAVGYSAGVTSNSFDNRRDSISVRGGTTAQYLDGLQRVVGFDNITRADPFTLERVELLRGPSSVLYGQGGVGGVVNLVSKRPQAEPIRELQLQSGSFGHQQIGLDFTGPLNADATWLYRLVAVGRDSGSQVNHVPDDRVVFAPSLTWAPSAATSLALQATHQKDKSGSLIGFFPWQGTLLPSPFGQIPTSTFTGEPGFDAFIAEQNALGYLFSHRVNDHWTVRQNFRHSQSEVDYRSAYTSFTADPATGRPARPVFNADKRTVNRDLIQQFNQLRSTQLDTQAEGHFGSGAVRHTLLLGMDAQQVLTQQSTGRGTAAPLDLYNPVYGHYTPPRALTAQPDTELHQAGIYLQDQIKFGERWVALLGLRHDRAKSQVQNRPASGSEDSATTKRAGLVYLAGGGWAPYLSYSESFLPLAGANVYAQAYTPQRGKQWEAGVKWEPANRNISTTAAIYDLRESNRKTSDPANPLNSLQIGEVHVKGLELEAVGSLGRRWDWTAAYTYTDARISRSNGADEGKRLAGVPAHSVSAWLSHRFAIAGQPGFSAGAGVRYVGSSLDGLDQLKVPAVTLLDAVFGYTRGPWHYMLNIKNLTDKVQLASCIARGDCFYGQRRTAVASVRYTF